MIRLMMIFTLSLFACSPALGAEEIKVRSGEHDGFVRLVFSVSPDNDWRVIEGSGKVTLRIEELDLDFDTSLVFAKISRSRIANVSIDTSQNGTGIQIELACECDVKAYAFQGSYIVLDISDPVQGMVMPLLRRDSLQTTASLFAPQVFVPHESSLAIDQIAPVQPRFQDDRFQVAFPEYNEDARLGGLAQAQAPDSIPSFVQVDETIGIGEVSNMSQAELTEAVEEARDKLLEQLTMAAEQGLVEFDVAPPEPVEDLPEETETAAEVVEEPNIQDLLANEEQISIQSVFNRDAQELFGQANAVSSNCLVANNLDVASWGSGNNFSKEMADIRSGLMQEFDAADLSKIRDLVRLYIRYGFGVEAGSYLKEYGDSIRGHALLVDLTAVIDGKEVIEGGPLFNARGCGGVAGLWAVVAEYPQIGSQIDDPDSIIDAFANLPIDIRRLLGPRLSMAFLERDMSEEGAKVTEIIGRAPGDHGSGYDLTMAKLAHSNGELEKAEQIYRQLTASRDSSATAALIGLAGLMHKQGKAFDAGLLADLGAYANEGRGTREGAELRRYYALGLARVEGGRVALDMLLDEIDNDPENQDILQQAAMQVLLELSPNTGATDYAGIVLNYSHIIDSSPEGDSLRLDIGEKLIEAGIPNAVSDILKPLVEHNDEDALVILAQANLLMFNPEVSIELVKEIEGKNARLIGIEAYLNLGAFEEALTEIGELAEGNRAIVKLGWYAGNWLDASQVNAAAATIFDLYMTDRPEQTGEIAEVASGTLSEDNQQQTGQEMSEEMTLAGLRETLENSSLAREELDILLEQK